MWLDGVLREKSSEFGDGGYLCCTDVGCGGIKLELYFK